MFAPKSYSVIQLPISLLKANEYNVSTERASLCDIGAEEVDMGYGMGVRQLFKLTGVDPESTDRIDSVVCINISNAKDEDIEYLYRNGIVLNGKCFVISERSQSMGRHNILTAVDAEVYDRFTAACLMDIDTSSSKKYVISKLKAYMGLMFSACHILEGFRPYIVIIPDCERIIKEQMVSYCKEEEVVSKNGDKYKRLCLKTEKKDIKMNLFDGGGIHTPEITDELQRRLGAKERPTSAIIRGPFIKGLSNEFDIKGFAAEKGITTITDYWGIEHNIANVDMIFTESMYKGLKFMDEYHDERDWDKYWQAFEKYDHAFGIVKWNYSAEQEPVYTRLNYQILQDLNVSNDEFLKLSDYSKKLFEGVVYGDKEVIWNFAGLTYEKHTDKRTKTSYLVPPRSDDSYARAILKNPECLKDPQVQKHFYGLILKYIDEMKCGKVYARCSFRFLVPDLVALAEHALGLPVVGVLKKGECFTQSKSVGIYDGEVIIERNPHLAKSEHCVLNAVNGENAIKWLGHLYNCIFLNGYDITCSRLSGCDYDGDCGLVIRVEDAPVIRNGIDTSLPVVINIDEKATAVAEEYTTESILKSVIFTNGQSIGEKSNMATCYRNKVSDNEKLLKMWDDFVNIICIINAKEIDSAKTQVRVRTPKHIQKYARPFPYFMRYAKSYYKGLKNFNTAMSNMNCLCYDIERWQEALLSKRPKDADRDFDHRIYMDNSVEIDGDTMSKLKSVYNEYRDFISAKKSLKKIKKNQWVQREVNKKKKERDNTDESKLFRYFNRLYNYERGMETDKKEYKNKYAELKHKCEKIVPDRRALATYLVCLCYEELKASSRSFAWLMAGDGIVENIESVTHYIPLRVNDPNESEFEYLGRYYKWQMFRCGKEVR